MRRTSLLVLSLLFALPAAAQVYQWRDAQGRINYSDTPPPSGNVQTVKGAPRKNAVVEETTDAGANDPAAPSAGNAESGKASGAKADPAKPKTMAEKELEFRQRRVASAEAEAKAEKERQQAAERARGCEQARAQLAGLRSGQRVARFTSDGQREVLDSTERAAELERTQKYIDSNCR